MSFLDGDIELGDVTAGQTLAAGGHAARHTEVKDALEEIRDGWPTKADQADLDAALVGEGNVPVPPAAGLNLVSTGTSLGDHEWSSDSSVRTSGAQTITGAKTFTKFRWSELGARTVGDGVEQLVNLVHDGDDGYLFHLTHGANGGGAGAGGYLMAFGLDAVGDGLLVRNKAVGRGITLSQLNTITSPTAYGLVGHQSSIAPMVFLDRTSNNSPSGDSAEILFVKSAVATPKAAARFQQAVSGGGTLLALEATAAASGDKLASFTIPGAFSEAGYVRADDGRLVWRKSIVAASQSGTSSARIMATNNTDTTVGNQVWLESTNSTLALHFRRDVGNSTHYPARLLSEAGKLKLQVSAASALGAESFNTIIELRHDQIGFFGTTSIGKRTGWGTATGTATRTTFDTSTVTVSQLAERVKALIDDLHATSGYGLLAS